MKKFVRRFFILFIVFLFFLFLDQYVLSAKYSFADPEPFRGNDLVNPYSTVELKDVAVANFHGHTKIWAGLTNGKGSASDLHRRYDSLGHDFHAVSQYHFIDTTYKSKSNYVAAYEHGYNLKKTHQLIVGSRKVVWKDYFFPQTIHNKQDLLIRLAKDTGNIVVLNHPAIRNGYSLSELTRLHYYDYIELLNPSAQSIAHWDTILSAGKKVFAMGNDDVHDVFNNNALGRFVTLIYGAGNNGKKMLSALKIGAAASVWLPQINDEKLEQKRIRISRIKNMLKSVQVSDQFLSFELKECVDSIKLITDHGRLKKMVVESKQLSDELLKKESYWRVEVFCSDGTRIFYNPVYRKNSEDAIARNQYGMLFVRQKKESEEMAYFFALIIMFMGAAGQHIKAGKSNKNRRWSTKLNLTK
jgi:hypothetical protein